MNAPAEIVNDATLGILAGAAEGWGVAVVSGSGCNCRGWDRERREGRVTGFGFSMGEGAGASEMIFKIKQAIAHDWTRRGPPTRLTQALVEFAGARDVEDFLEALTLQRIRLPIDAARLVFHIAAAGDAVARDLIVWAGQELGSLAVGVIRQLELEAEAFDVVMVGSFFNGSPLLAHTMGEVIHTVASGARLVRLTAPPVVGAVRLAMEQAALHPLPLHERLIESTNQMLDPKNLQAASRLA